MKNLILIFAFVFSSNLSWAYSVQPEMQSMSSRSQAQVDNYAEFLNRAYPEANIHLSEEGLLSQDEEIYKELVLLEQVLRGNINDNNTLKLKLVCCPKIVCGCF